MDASADLRFVVVTGDPFGLTLIDRSTGVVTPLQPPPGFDQVAEGVTTPDGRWLSLRATTAQVGQPFVYDRATSTFYSLPGVPVNANIPMGAPATISDDGSRVAVVTSTLLLDATAPSGVSSVYVWDVHAATVERVSDEHGATGLSRNALTADGAAVAFSASPHSPDTTASQAFVSHVASGLRQLASHTAAGMPGNGPSFAPHVTSDGLLARFDSQATDLVITTGPTGPSISQIYLYETVPFDSVPPVVTGTADPPPNAAGWNNSDVTITWDAFDPPPSSGTPTQPPSSEVTSEGANQLIVSEPSCDPAGNCATGSLTVSIDRTPPTGSITTPNGAILIGPARLAGTAADGLSGVSAVTVTYTGASTVTVSASLACNAARTSCTWRATTPFPPLLVGAYVARATITDVASNRSTTAPRRVLVIL